MSDKKVILLCGATGFIGRNLLQYFSHLEGFEIRAIYHDRPPVSLSNSSSSINWVKADLRNPQEVDSIMQNIDVVIQAAATTSGSKDIVTKPYIHVTDNAVMNSILLKCAFHNKVKHFIFFSCTVMYQSSDTALMENDFNPSLRLNERYFGVGHTKLYIEKMLEFFSSISQMKTTAIRHSNIYGPYDKFDFEHSHVFGATVSKVMLADDKVVVWGSGEEERDLLHVNDLCEFVEKTILHQKSKFGLYNCGLGSPVSVSKLVEKIIKASEKSLDIEYDLTKPTIKTSLFLNSEKAKTELNWKPKISLDEGISMTVDWWKKNIDRDTLKSKD